MENITAFEISGCELHLLNNDENIVELKLPNKTFYKTFSDDTIIKYVSQYNRANERIDKIYFDLSIFENGKSKGLTSYFYSVDYDISAYNTGDFTNPKLRLDEKIVY